MVKLDSTRLDDDVMRDVESAFYVWEFGELDIDEAQPPKQKDSSELLELEITFRDGEPILEDLSPVDFIVSPNRKLVDYQFNIGGIPLFSEKLRTLLKNEGVELIQYFDARIFSSRGRLHSNDYKVANITKSLECLDWERSVYDDSYREYGVAGDIEKLRLRRDFETDIPVFRMAEAPRIILAATRVKNALEHDGITGVVMVPISEYATP